MINNQKRRIKELRDEFYNQSFTSQLDITDAGQRVFSVRPEAVIEVVDAIGLIETNIEKNVKRIRYLSKYIESLPKEERTYIYRKYIKGYNMLEIEHIEAALYDEIMEIEAAMCFMYGYEPETFEDDLVQKVKIIDDRALNYDFDSALILLGVNT